MSPPLKHNDPETKTHKRSCKLVIPMLPVLVRFINYPFINGEVSTGVNWHCGRKEKATHRIPSSPNSLSLPRLSTVQTHQVEPIFGMHINCKSILRDPPTFIERLEEIYISGRDTLNNILTDLPELL